MSDWLLYYHPESECLFWSQSREGNEQCDEIGTAPKKSRSTAENIWNILPKSGKPKFADIYKEKDEEPAKLNDEPASADVFETKARWEGAPKVCTYENLLAFAAEKDIGKFLSESAPGMYAMEKWQCPKCAHWHMLTGSPPVGHSAAREFHAKPPRAVRDKLVYFATEEEKRKQITV